MLLTTPEVYGIIFNDSLLQFNLRESSIMIDIYMTYIIS